MTKKMLFVIIAFALLACSACEAESEASKNESHLGLNISESEVYEASVVSEDPFATKEWESETRKDGNVILYKYTKVFDGDANNYTVTALEYTNNVLTGKIITVVTDGAKTYEEEYKYDREIIILSSKNKYASGNGSIPVYSSRYEVVDYSDNYSSFEYEHYYSADGSIEKGTAKYYSSDGSLYQIEDISVKALDGFDCIYTVTTTYEHDKVVDIKHQAYSRDMKYSYTEYRNADNALLYTKKCVDDINTYTFPEVGGMSVSGTWHEFFAPNGNSLAKGRIENNIINLYENASNLSTQEVLDIIGDILDKANEFGVL